MPYLIIFALLFSFIQLPAEEVHVTIPNGSLEVDGRAISWQEENVSIATPSVATYTSKIKAPGNYQKAYANKKKWPNWVKGHKAISLLPDTRSVDGTLMLGSMYKTIIPESVTVINESKQKLKRDIDFKFNPVWGQLVGVNNKLGTEGKSKITVSFQYRMQRIDLVQVDASGKLSVKTGTESILCPVRPDADAGATAIAGIYVHPFLPEHGSAYAISKAHVFLVKAPQQQPVLNKHALARSLSLLKDGKTIKIALLGDSVTLGAEAGFWWEDRSKTWTGRTIAGLKQQFLNAQITEIPAYKGGITTAKGAEFFEKDVAPAKPDLLFIALGLNDASGSAERGPKVPAPAFKAAILKMVQAAKNTKTEVVIVTPFRGNPFNATGQHIKEHQRVLLEIANEEQVACADVYTAWERLGERGIAPYSQIHNWINHPGEFGHSVYADCILSLFK